MGRARSCKLSTTSRRWIYASWWEIHIEKKKVDVYIINLEREQKKKYPEEKKIEKGEKSREREGKKKEIK